MCETEPTTIARIITSPLSDDWLNRQARQFGVVKRQRTVEASALVWVLVLAFSHHKSLAIAALHRTYARRTGHNISYSTFYDRFTPALKKLLKQAVHHLTDHCKTLIPHFDGPMLNAFSRLTVIDSTLIRLHPSLRNIYPSTDDNCAKLKIHAVYLATMGLFDRFKFSDGLTHDRKAFKRVGPWVKGSIVLMDLGYWCFHLQWLIAQNEAYFLTRAKIGFNPLITAVHGNVRGASIDVVGKRLQDVLLRLNREVIDFEVEVEFHKEARGGKRTKQTAKWRLVGILNKQTGEHHLYLTNIGPGEMEAKLVAQLYRERWQVEIMFKALKSCLRADQLPTSNKDVAEVLVWAALLRFVLSQLILLTIRQLKGVTAKRMPMLRWQRLFEEMSDDLLRDLVQAVKPTSLLDWAIHFAQDPNSRQREFALHILSKLASVGLQPS